MLGTIMAANVLFVIIPSQKQLVAAKLAGRGSRTRGSAQRAKQRSVHNNYLTLPVVFTMLSSHFAFTYAHPYNWAGAVRDLRGRHAGAALLQPAQPGPRMRRAARRGPRHDRGARGGDRAAWHGKGCDSVGEAAASFADVREIIAVALRRLSLGATQRIPPLRCRPRA